jgi:hypothetical protein
LLLLWWWSVLRSLDQSFLPFLPSFPPLPHECVDAFAV